jgi:hypothetical protein
MMYTGRSSSGSSHAWPLVQPYDLVWVEFTPPGIDHPVQTVDVVDDGSVANLTKGGTVQITYPTDDPRAARLVGATYRHLWINNLAYLGSTLLGLAIFGLIAILLGALSAAARAKYRPLVEQARQRAGERRLDDL